MALLGLDAIYDLHYEAIFSEKEGLSRRTDGRSGTRTTSAGALVSAKLIAVSMFPHR